MSGQVEHRESRPGNTQQVWKMKDALRSKTAVTRLPLASARLTPFLGLAVTSSRRPWDSLSLSYLPRRSPGLGRLPRTVPGARASTPGPLPGRRRLPRGRRRRACPARPAFERGRQDGRRAGEGAARNLRLGPEPGAQRGSPAQPRRRPAAKRDRAEVMGKGGGRAIMKGKWWAGGPARAAAVLTRAGQCG